MHLEGGGSFLGAEDQDEDVEEVQNISVLLNRHVHVLTGRLAID